MSLLVRWLLGFVLLGSVGLVIMANARRDPIAADMRWASSSEAPWDVQCETATHGRLVHSVEAPGEIIADIEVNVSSQVMGRIVSLPVREGDVVKKGDLLAALDSVDFEAEFRRADAKVGRLRAAIDMAALDVEKGKRDLDLTQKLLETKAVGSTEVADLRTLYSKARAKLAMSDAELVEAEGERTRAAKNLQDATIRSPINGIVSKLIAKEGEVVVVGTMNNPGTVILVVSDLSSRVVRAQIDETDAPRVAPGQRATVHLRDKDYPSLAGVVERIYPKGEKALRGFGLNENDVATFPAMVKLDSPPDYVRLGMFANVEIAVGERSDALTIPSRAVVHRQLRDLPPRLAERLRDEAKANDPGKDFSKQFHQVVFVEKNGRAECRRVRTGISDERGVEILEGITAGESVVVGPYKALDKIKDGSPLLPIGGSSPRSGNVK